MSCVLRYPSDDPESSKVCEETRCVTRDGTTHWRTDRPVVVLTSTSSGPAVETAMFGEALIEFEKDVSVWADLFEKLIISGPL